MRRPLILLVTTLTACRVTTPPVEVDTDSTAELLTRCAALITPDVPFSGESLLAETLAEYRHDVSARVERLRLAACLLRLGRTYEAIDLYDELYAEGTASSSAEEFLEDVEFPRAVAYLRLGEQENCVRHNGPASCLFPIAEEAVHSAPRGSRRAVDILTSILRRRPENVSAKWLLNVAHMTLGSHPAGVPSRWLVRPEEFRPTYDVGAFSNVAPQLGVAGNGLGGGVIVEDFDGDTYLDILVSTPYPIDDPRGQLRLYLNDRRGSFRDATESAGLIGIYGGLNMLQADYDNNGFPDVFILRGAWRLEDGRWPNTLLRNNGDGTFSDVTVAAGVLSFYPTQAAAWGDFDNDGWIDLFVANETGVPARGKSDFEETLLLLFKGAWALFDPGVQGHLYRNTGRGTFVDVYYDIGLGNFGWVKGVSWGDFDNDGRLDLYISRLADDNLLYRNQGPDEDGDWSFKDVAEEAGVVEPIVSFATWFWDYDNDGHLDLFAAGYPYPDVSFPGRGFPIEIDIDSRPEVLEFLGRRVDAVDGRARLFRNRGDGTFDDVTEAMGLSAVMSPMGGNFGDVDNDGFLDIYLGTGAPQFDYLVPNRVFCNPRGRGFQDATVSSRMGHLQKGHGTAFGDFDNDGDQDLYVALGGAFPGDTSPNALFRNPGNGNSWVTLVLEGTRANRSAIGAKLRLDVVGPSGKRSLHRRVGSGGSFGSSSLQQEIGLGDAHSISRLVVVWPDASSSVEVFDALEPRRTYEIRQGAGEATERVVQSIELGAADRTW